MKRFIVFICTLIIVNCIQGFINVEGRELEVEWEKRLGYTVCDYITSVTQVSDGGYIIGGVDITSINGIQKTNGVVVKFDINGNIEWKKIFNSNNSYNNCGVRDVQKTNDGGCIIGVDKYDDKQKNIYIVKLDSNGNLEWEKNIGGTGADYIKKIKQTSDNGYVICGMSNSKDGDVNNNVGDLDGLIVKLNSKGEILWVSSIGTKEADYLYDINQTSDGGFIACGEIKLPYPDDNNPFEDPYFRDYDDSDGLIVKLDSSGNIEWEKHLKGVGQDTLLSIKQRDDGIFVAGGQSDYIGDSTRAAWTIKLNELGETKFEKHFDFNGSSSIIWDIEIQNNDNMIITGSKDSGCWLAELNIHGEMEWEKIIKKSDYNRGNCVQKTSDGGIIVGGSIYSKNDDGWIVKLSGTGDLVMQDLIILCTNENTRNTIEINGEGTAYNYYNLLMRENGSETILRNKKVTYGFSGYDIEYTATTDSNGQLIIKTPKMTQTKELTIEIKSVSEMEDVTFSPKKLNIDVKPHSFKQEWGGQVGAGLEGSVSLEVGAEAGPLKGEVGVAGVSGEVIKSNGIKIISTFEGGKRTLQLSGRVTADLATGIKGGLYSNVGLSVSPVELALVNTYGNVKVGNYLHSSINIDDYNPNDSEDLYNLGTFLLQHQLISSGQDNVVTDQILKMLKINEEINKGVGARLKLDYGAKALAISYLGEENFSGKTHNRFFSYDAIVDKIKNNITKTSYYIGESKTNTILGNETNSSEIKIEANTDSYDNIKNFKTKYLTKKSPLPGDSGLAYSASENEYVLHEYSSDDIKLLNDEYISKFSKGDENFISESEFETLTDNIVRSNIQSDYTILEEIKKGLEFDINLGLKLILGAKAKFKFLGVDSLEYDVEEGVKKGDDYLKYAELNIKKYANENKLTLLDIASEPLVAIGDKIKDFFVSVTGNVLDGVKNGAAEVGKSINGIFNNIVSISKIKNDQIESRSYLLRAAPYEGASISESYIAVTVGDPYIIMVEDQNSTELEVFEPINLKLSYTSIMLDAAGLTEESTLLDSIKIYYWDYDKNNYICLGGNLDKVNKFVSLDITKAGQYILAIDNLAPSINNFRVSDNTSTPIISAYINDMSGLDASTFNVMIDDTVLVDEINFNDYYNYNTGLFSYKVIEPLSSGFHTASIIVSDTSGNILPEAVIYEFIVDSNVPVIESIYMNQLADAGEEVGIEVKINDDNINRVYVDVKNTEEYPSTIESLELESSDTINWTGKITKTMLFNELDVKVVAYDEAGNKTESDILKIKINTDKSKLIEKVQSAERFLSFVVSHNSEVAIRENVSKLIDDGNVILDDETSSQKTINNHIFKIDNTLNSFSDMWIEYKLKIVSENGNVNISPEKSAYSVGEVVSLIAMPNAGFEFSGWSGDITETNQSVIITVDKDMNIVANYKKLEGDLNTNITTNNWISGEGTTTYTFTSAHDGRYKLFFKGSIYIEIRNSNGDLVGKNYLGESIEESQMIYKKLEVDLIADQEYELRIVPKNNRLYRFIIKSDNVE